MSPSAQATHWPAIAAVILAGVAASSAFGKISPALPLLKQDFGLSLIQAGWLAGAFSGLAATSAIFFGVLADRAGAFRFCIGGLACIAAGSLVGALSPDATVLVLSRLIEGAGFVALQVSGPALIVAAAAPERRGLAFGLSSTGFPIGIALIILTSQPMYALYGWRAAWMLVAFAALACALLLITQSHRYAGLHVGTSRSLSGLGRVLSQPGPWLPGLAFAMYVIQNVAVIVWLPTYLMETRGISGTAATLATALVVIVNCVGNVLGGWLLQRNVAPGRIIGVTFSITSILFCAIFSPALPDSARYALTILYNMIAGLVPAAALSASMRYARSPAEVGTIQGLMVQLTNVGLFSGPPLVAWVVALRGSWDSALWVMLGAAAVGLAVAFFISRDERAAK